MTEGPVMLPGSVELEEATEALADQLADRQPQVMLTLGSGLGSLADAVTDRLEIAFADIGLPDTTVPGHAGQFVSGTLQGVEVLVQQGRVHLYEGHGVGHVVAAVRAAAGVGCRVFVATNAAGGIVEHFNPGDLMVITDHINFSGHNALTGIVPPNFLDQTDAYSSELRASFAAAAADEGVALQEGIYVGLAGPTFESRAEIEMFRRAGAQAVGMSTVNEVIAANAAGMKVLGCSLITNVHRPGGTPTNHEEVMVEGKAAGPRLARAIATWLPSVA